MFSPLFALRQIPACLSLGLVSALAWPSAQAQSLTELYQVARDYDASYRAARSQYEATQARADQAKANLRPTLNLQSTVSRSQVSGNIDGVPYFKHPYGLRQNGLSLSQPLYRPGNLASYRQGEKLLIQADAQLALAEQDLIVRVSQAYFDVLAAHDSLVFVQAQKVAVKEQLASAKRNFEVGTATITDTREAQAREDLVISQEIAAQNELRVKQLFLDQLVGRSNTQPLPLKPQAELPTLPSDRVESWVESAQEHPQVQLAQTTLDVATLEIAKAEAGQKPTVDLNGSYAVAHNMDGSSLSPTSRVSSRITQASIGVTLNFPLYAGGALQSRVREALSLQEKAQADLDTARRSTAQATRTAFYGVLSGTSQVKALQAAEVSSQSALDANMLGYKVGVRINIDVLNSQSQLYQTKRDLALARYSVLVGGLKLRQANGSLTPDDLQSVNALLAP
ncbi:TolC family outer membrane protein [Curvibacter sp. RS43]|uniref:TolC family outer membrane protein n=1 Tax=Curvibacter microcysteis TaxID=3026419 RepID=A0ABT5MEL1_9BURK|nr:MULTISPECIES: TolC family outer membrane protein [unclassified Curvibacter]MDD0809843.1 TolC family outer membrane protein [Curvibacter sp. RS43]MDD0815018.1 TolC family outer membrane protein [Curvibacter sp. HBC28]